MNHSRALQEISDDPSFCKECGGWLGRKPGTKPYCTLPDCPGSRAATPGTGGKRPMPAHATFASRTRDEDEEQAIKSRPSPQQRAASSPAVVSTPPSRLRSRRLSDEEDDGEEGPSLVLPSLEFMAVCAASSALAVGWSYYAFVLAGADDDSSTTLVLLCTCTGLLAASPLLAWLFRFPFMIEINRNYLTPLVANTLLLLNILVLLILVFEPMVPQPGGSEAELALCVDVADGWRIKYDKAMVVGGPCFELEAEYVAGAAPQS